MNELRVDPLTGLKSIIAAGRASRPGGGFHSDPADPVDPEKDPFLEGHEDRTPPEVWAQRPGGGPPDSPGWLVRSVPEPLSRRSARTPRRPPPHPNPDLFTAQAAAGAQEVIVNAPDPVTSLADLTVEQVETAVDGLAHAHAAPTPTPPSSTCWSTSAARAARRCRTRTRSSTRCRSSPPPSPASASASPPTRRARWAATCSATCCRRRCGCATASWRSTSTRCCWRPTPRACRSSSCSSRAARTPASRTRARPARRCCTTRCCACAAASAPRRR